MSQFIAGLLLSAFAALGWTETLIWGPEREGPDYQNFTDVPFNSQTIGGGQVSIKNGVMKPEGAWVDYHHNGKLFIKSSYKNGKREGSWVAHYENGQLLYKGDYKDDRSEGCWFFYEVEGTLIAEISGNYKDGEKISNCVTLD